MRGDVPLLVGDRFILYAPSSVCGSTISARLVVGLIPIAGASSIILPDVGHRLITFSPGYLSAAVLLPDTVMPR